jgi:thiol-disulfide isomerase/thioredoxin
MSIKDNQVDVSIRIASRCLLLLLSGTLPACRVRESGEPGTGAAPPLGGSGATRSALAIPGLPAGQVVLLDVWAPWDEPSREGQKEIDALAAAFAPQGLAVLGWAIDDGTAPAAWPQVSYPRQSVSRDLVEKLGVVRALPTRLLVDRKGVVRHIYPGTAMPTDIHTTIAALLAEH